MLMLKNAEKEKTESSDNRLSFDQNCEILLSEKFSEIPFTLLMPSAILECFKYIK